MFQRSALAVAANCCQNVTDFQIVSEAIPVLSARLQNQVGVGFICNNSMVWQSMC